MIEGWIYVNKVSGGFYECVDSGKGRGIAVMALVASGYGGDDPKRQAVFLDSLDDWELASDEVIEAEITRAEKVIEGHYEQARWFVHFAEEMKATNDYLEGKLHERS